MTKCDLLESETQIEKLTDASCTELLTFDERSKFNMKHANLNKKICEIIDKFALVKFFPLNIKDTDSLIFVMGQCD